MGFLMDMLGIKPPSNLFGAMQQSMSPSQSTGLEGTEYDPAYQRKKQLSDMLHAVGQGLVNPALPGAGWGNNLASAVAQGGQVYDASQQEAQQKQRIGDWISTLPPNERAFAIANPDKAAELYVYQNKPVTTRSQLPASYIQMYDLYAQQTKAAGEKVKTFNDWVNDFNYNRASSQAGGKIGGAAGAELDPALVDANQTVAAINDALADPNLGSATGWQGYVPNALLPLTPGAGQGALNARTKIERLKGRAFMDAYAVLKGGGSITEKEGEKAQVALARLEDPRISDEDYRAALVEFRDAVQVGINKLSARAGRPAPQINPVVDPEQPPEGVSQEEWDAMTPEERAAY
jgi:hypothetical protein